MRIGLFHGWELRGSGSNEYTRYLARALVRAGHDVEILCRDEAPEDIDSDLKGQTAIVTGEEDICAAAKVLKEFAEENSKPALRSGLLDGKYLSPQQIAGLAELPPKPVLLAQLLGVLNAPGSKLVRTLNEPGAALARLLQAKADQGG